MLAAQCIDFVFHQGSNKKNMEHYMLKGMLMPLKGTASNKGVPQLWLDDEKNPVHEFVKQVVMDADQHKNVGMPDNDPKTIVPELFNHMEIFGTGKLPGNITSHLKTLNELLSAALQTQQIASGERKFDVHLAAVAGKLTTNNINALMKVYPITMWKLVCLYGFCEMAERGVAIKSDKVDM